MLRTEILDSVETDEGRLELRKRGEKDFMILVGGRILMTSSLTTSELVLAEKGLASLATAVAPRVLIGGLGLGFTLRAALNTLPQSAEVVVAELNSKVVEWCKGPVACATDNAAMDPRVRFTVGNVTDEIRRIAEDAALPRYNAVLWDLYVGPPQQGGDADPLFGDASVRNTCAALCVGGVFGVWGESPSPAFETRLRRHGFSPERVLAPQGMRHAVYLAVKR